MQCAYNNCSTCFGSNWVNLLCLRCYLGNLWIMVVDRVSSFKIYHYSLLYCMFLLARMLHTQSCRDHVTGNLKFKRGCQLVLAIRHIYCPCGGFSLNGLRGFISQSCPFGVANPVYCPFTFPVPAAKELPPHPLPGTEPRDADDSRTSRVAE